MKKVISLLMVILFITSTLYSQVSVTTSASNIKNAKKVEYKNGTSDYESGIPFCYGTTITSVYTARIRSIASFPIPASIPIGSQVYKVEFNFNPLGSIGFSVYYFENCPSSPTNTQAYELADDGSYVGSYSSSIGAYTETMPGSIVTAINNAVANSISTVYFGIISANEYINAGATEMTSLSLKIYYRRPVSFSVRNSFNAGQINLNGTTHTSGYTINTNEDLSQTFGAIEPQSNSGVNYVWNDTEGTLNLSKWDRIKGTITTNKGTTQSITYTTIYDDDGCEFVANLRPRYNATFQNSFSGGTLTVAGNSVSSPATTQVVEGNNITVSASQLYANLNSSGLDYLFNSWEDGSTNLSRTYTVNSNVTHTASYTRRANTSECFEWEFTNVAVGNYIQLTWNEHPNTNVTQYKIWRRAKDGTEGYIGTVNRGTTSFTDNSYQYASIDDPDGNTLYYNVYVYCSLDAGTWNSDGMALVTGVGDDLAKKPEQIAKNEMPTEYKLENYPNPFNPTTTISYQLPEAGMVTLKVYDMLGKEVATLVNEVKQAGYYSATFDASKLASGIYISTIQTNNFTQSKKMLLVK